MEAFCAVSVGGISGIDSVCVHVFLFFYNVGHAFLSSIILYFFSLPHLYEMKSRVAWGQLRHLARNANKFWQLQLPLSPVSNK